MGSQMNDASRLRHRRKAAAHLPQDPGYFQACGPSSFSPRPAYLHQHQYSSSQSSSPCQFHTPPELSSHARSQSYSDPYQQYQQPPLTNNGQRHNRPRRPVHPQNHKQQQQQQQQRQNRPETATAARAENMSPKLSSQTSVQDDQQPSLLKLTSVLTTIATLPGRRVARAARRLYSYPGNSVSDPDLTDITGENGAGRKSGTTTNPGTPPPDYDAAMESGAEEDSDSFASAGSDNGGEIERRPDSAMMVEDNEISRKFAKQGHHLLTLSLAEIDNDGQGPSRAVSSFDQDSFSNSFTRQLYVHSLTYLLRALPQSLTIEEVAGITSALPESVVDSISYQERIQNTHVHNQHCCCHQVVEIPPAMLPKYPTLHKLAMLSSSSMVTLLRSMTPHLKVLLLQIWLFCQRHRLAERGVDLMKNCGDYGVWAGGIILHWLDIQGLLSDATTTESQTEVEVHGTAEGSSGSNGGVVVSGAAVSRSTTTVRRRIVRGGAETGGKVIRDMSSWVGGVVSSSVSGVVDGINAGMEKPL